MPRRQRDPNSLADKRPKKKRVVERYEQFTMSGQAWESPLTFGVKISTLPPSANAMYDDIPVRRGGKTTMTKLLSDSAKNWRIAFKREFFKIFGHVLHKINELHESDRFECWLTFQSPQVVSKGFPDEAQMLFREIDVDNRIKFAMDTFCGALGLNDKISFRNHSEKHYHETDEHITMYLRQTQDTFGLTDRIIALGANVPLKNPVRAKFKEDNSE